ncbi:MAG: helix-hairpin-helix domain-containing protein [Flavobacteriia bacterium]|nr:helix-hairpin-helix domain-containing protein [Flavobacteriia bacterium]
MKITISKSKIADFEKRRKEYYQKTSYAKRKTRYKAPALRFDPNTYKKEDWLRLGLSEKQVNVVLKFTEKGIYSNEDLQKIFVIPAALFTLMKDSTFYPCKPIFNKIEKVPVPLTKIEIDLNMASENELLTIKGLGPYYAKAILKYKNELGGFVRKSQVMEIYKMNTESYEKIIPYLKINPSDVRTININEATVEELNAHPYLNWGQANSLVKMRMQKNGFKNINEIKQSHLIDEETYEKLLPYLSL